MSKEIGEIKGRLAELTVLVQQGIVPKNATENYLRDVATLVNVAYALRNMVANMLRRLDETNGRTALDKGDYLITVDRAITKLISGEFAKTPVLERPN